MNRFCVFTFFVIFCFTCFSQSIDNRFSYTKVKSEYSLFTYYPKTSSEMAQAYYFLGKFYESRPYGKFVSFKFFTKAKQFLEIEKRQFSFEYSEICKELAKCYFQFGDFDKSLRYHLFWYLLQTKNSQIDYSMLNSLGLALQKLDYHHYALGCFKKVNSIAKKNNDLIYQALSIGNMSKSFERLGLIDKAIQCLKIDIKISNQSENFGSSALALIHLAKLEFQSKPDSSILNLKQSENLLKFENKQPNSEYFFLRSSIYKNLGEFRNALDDFQMAIKIRDIENSEKYSSIASSLANEDFIKRKTNDYNQLIHKNKVTSLYLWFILIGLFLTIALTIRLYYQEKQKREFEKLTFDYKKQLVTLELERKSNELESLIQSFVKKYEFSKYIANLTENNPKFSKAFEQNELQEINLSSHENRILTNEDWFSFRRQFEIIYPLFIDSLVKAFPEITTSEIRLSCLLRLNKNFNEIASILGISTLSVKRTNLRLRKRLNKNSNDELIEYLFSISYE